MYTNTKINNQTNKQTNKQTRILTYVHIYIYAHIHTHMHIKTSVHAYIHMHGYMYVGVFDEEETVSAAGHRRGQVGLRPSGGEDRLPAETHSLRAVHVQSAGSEVSGSAIGIVYVCRQ